ncbi:MAG: DNA methyltransferase, partial [Acidobacteriota bacterium]
MSTVRTVKNMEYERAIRPRGIKRSKSLKSIFRTRLGALYVGQSEMVLAHPRMRRLYGKVQLILTSPPFPLNTKKRYGNEEGEQYVQWLASFAPLFRKLLKRNGSIVIEMGNAWVPGRPVQSTLSLHALLKFMEHPEVDLRLCQEFICFNPAKLPTPAQWVTI